MDGSHHSPTVSDCLESLTKSSILPAIMKTSSVRIISCMKAAKLRISPEGCTDILSRKSINWRSERLLEHPINWGRFGCLQRHSQRSFIQAMENVLDFTPIIQFSISLLHYIKSSECQVNWWTYCLACDIFHYHFLPRNSSSIWPNIWYIPDNRILYV